MDWFLLAFFSAFFSAFAAVSQKKVLLELSALNFSFVLSLFNVLFSVPLLLTFQITDIYAESMFILFIKAILGAFAFLFVMLAIKNMEISGALPLMVLSPGLVAIAAFLFLNEGLTGYEIGGILLLLSGTYLLEIKKDRKLLDPLKVFINSKNHYYVLGALLLFTVSALLDKVLLIQYSLEPTAFILIQHIFQMIIFLVLVIIKGNLTIVLNSVSKINYGWIMLIAALTIGYRIAQLEAFKIAPVALVLAIKRISVFFATVLGGKIFKEHDLIKKAVATAIMIIGAILVF